MSEKIKIAIIEDHALVREGIKSIINKNRNMEITGEADNVDDGYSVALSARPDLLLLDISLHGLSGLELAKRILKKIPELRIIIITMYSKLEYILQSLDLGINGYILKETSSENLIDCIEKVLDGEIYIDTHISNKVIKSLINKKDVQITDNKSLYGRLTLREQEILRLLVESVPVKQIAEELFISTKTVENHKASIMIKLNCKNMVELVRYAITIGLIDA